MPVAAPMYSPVKYDTKNVPDVTTTKYGLVGSRGDTCAACVESRKHVNEWINKANETKIDTCGGSLNVVMVISAFKLTTTDWKTKKQQTQWINWRDLTIHPEVKEALYEVPPTIVFSISRSVGMKTVKSQELGLKDAPEHAKSWNEFYNMMLAEKRISFLDEAGYRQMVNAEVQMDLADPDPKTVDTIKSVPVFSMVTPDTFNSAIKNAVNDMFKAAFTEAGGSFDDKGVLPSTSQNKALLQGANTTVKEVQMDDEAEKSKSATPTSDTKALPAQAHVDVESEEVEDVSVEETVDDIFSD